MLFIKTAILLVFTLLTCACAPLQPKTAIERKHYASYEMDIGYAQVVRVGKTLYISGVVSTAPTLAQQLEEEYRFISTILSNYGASADAIVKETIFTLDMAALKQAIPVRKQFFLHNLYPSASWVQVSALYDPAIVVEIEVEAQLP